MKIKTQARLKGANIYSNYQKLKAAKEQCYPQKEFTVISESVAEVKLQALLDHTASRLVRAQELVIDSIPKDIYDMTEVEPESSEEAFSESDEFFGNTQSDFESDY